MSDDTPKPPGSDSNQPPASPPPPPPPGPPVPPPPPGAGAPPPAGGAPAPFSVGNAFSFGWAKFQENIGPWLIAVVGAVVGFAIFSWIVTIFLGLIVNAFGGTASIAIDPVTGELSSSAGAGAFVIGLSMAVQMLLVGFVSLVIMAQFVRAALETVRTGKIELSTFFDFRNIGTIVIAAVIIAGVYFLLALIGIIPILGWLIFFVGTIVVGFFAQFYVYYVLDDDQSAMDAIKASFAFVNKNLVSIVVLYIATYVTLIIGVMLCFVGLLVAIPVAVMAHAYTFRSLNGESIAA